MLTYLIFSILNIFSIFSSLFCFLLLSNTNSFRRFLDLFTFRRMTLADLLLVADTWLIAERPEPLWGEQSWVFCLWSNAQLFIQTQSARHSACSACRSFGRGGEEFLLESIFCVDSLNVFKRFLFWKIFPKFPSLYMLEFHGWKKIASNRTMENLD